MEKDKTDKEKQEEEMGIIRGKGLTAMKEKKGAGKGGKTSSLEKTVIKNKIPDWKKVPPQPKEKQYNSIVEKYIKIYGIEGGKKGARAWSKLDGGAPIMKKHRKELRDYFASIDKMTEG